MLYQGSRTRTKTCGGTTFEGAQATVLVWGRSPDVPRAFYAKAGKVVFAFRKEPDRDDRKFHLRSVHKSALPAFAEGDQRSGVARGRPVFELPAAVPQDRGALSSPARRIVFDSYHFANNRAYFYREILKKISVHILYQYDLKRNI